MAQETKKHPIRNWSAYNQALINRGNLTIWIEDTPKKWMSSTQTGKKGCPKTYSDDAILLALVLRSMYHLPLRALEGFITSLFQMMHSTLPVPCYTQICRRAAHLDKSLPRLSSKTPTDVVFDSTGVKVYGEGEWKVRQHGKGKRRIWKKVHLAICPQSHEIIMSELTESTATDGKVCEKMIPHLPESVKNVLADGAYDQGGVYQELHKKDIKSIIPPRKNSKPKNLDEAPWYKDRNEALQEISTNDNQAEGRKAWKQSSGYHTRSLVETAMFRFKCIFGGNFRSRETRRQKAELFAKSIAMNKMTQLGMPQRERIAA